MLVKLATSCKLRQYFITTAFRNPLLEREKKLTDKPFFKKLEKLILKLFKVKKPLSFWTYLSFFHKLFGIVFLEPKEC